MSCRVALLVLALGACFADRASRPTPTAPPAVASAAPIAAPDPDAPLLPLDGSRIGTLANGLTYIIGEPTPAGSDHDDRMYAALAVRAGSLDETDAQAGAAHLLAHLVAPLIDEDFRPDTDADTRDISTAYTVQLYDPDVGETDPTEIVEPPDPLHALDHELARLRRVVDGKVSAELFAALHANLHDRERVGAVLPAELAATAMARHPAYEAPNAHYANLDLASVLEFRRTWYRADRIAVVVVTEEDPAVVAREIAKRFGSLPRPTAPMPAASSIVAPPHPGFAALVVPPPVPPAPPFRRAWLTQRVPHVSPRGERGQRAMIVDDILDHIVRARLRIAQPMRSWRAWTRMTFTDQLDLISMNLDADDLDDEHVFVRELARVRQHGVTDDEVARATTDLTADVHTSSAGTGQSNREHTEALAEMFTAGTPPPSPAYADAYARIAAGITAAEIAGAARRELALDARTLELPAAVAHDTTAAALTAELTALDADPLEPWEQRPATRPILAHVPVPPPRAIVKTATTKEATIWTLANGARVIVQPTRHTSRSVQVAPTSIVGQPTARVLVAVPGGWARLDPQAALAVRAAGEYLADAGLGDQPAEVLHQILAERGVNASLDLQATTSELSFRGDVSRLETVVQLAYLALSSPRVEASAVERWRARTIAAIAATTRADPMHDAVVRANAQIDAATGDLPETPFSAADVARIAADPARGLDAFRDEVGDIAHATIIITGNLAPATVRPLVERYFAALQPMGRRIVTRPRAMPALGTPPAIVHTGGDQRNSYVVEYVAPATGDLVRDRRDATVLGWALDDQLDRVVDERYETAVTAHATDDGRIALRVEGYHLPEPVRAEDFADVDRALADLATGGPDARLVGELQNRGVANVYETDFVRDLLTAAFAGKDLAAAIVDAGDASAQPARIMAALIRASARRFGRPRVQVAFEPVM